MFSTLATDSTAGVMAGTVQHRSNGCRPVSSWHSQVGERTGAGQGRPGTLSAGHRFGDRVGFGTVVLRRRSSSGTSGVAEADAERPSGGASVGLDVCGGGRTALITGAQRGRIAAATENPPSVCVGVIAISGGHWVRSVCVVILGRLGEGRVAAGCGQPCGRAAVDLPGCSSNEGGTAGQRGDDRGDFVWLPEAA